MEYKTIQKEIILKTQPIFCFHCGSKNADDYKYLFLKNTFYCPSCFKDLGNINSVFDIKFNDINDKLLDLMEGLIDKNARIKILEENVNNMLMFFDKILQMEN